MDEFSKDKKENKSAWFAAAFLMAASAIGPGFLTQTTQFTAQYTASLSFVIVCVILMDAIAQTNIWSIIGVTGLHGQEIANKVLPGLGTFLIVLISLGGLAFNVGNISGAAIGLETLFGLNEKIGAAISGVFAVCLFLAKGGKRVIDKVAQAFSGCMLLIIIVICFVVHPPVLQAVKHIVMPESPKNLIVPIITLLGGSCGGYITFSGAHRLLDAGKGGHVEDGVLFRKSVLTGICVSGTTRMVLFLAVLGVCMTGGIVLQSNIATITSSSNPAAAAFGLAAGRFGTIAFGVVLFFAGLTSVLGAAYTSVSFLKTLHPFIEKNEKWFICGFIVVSTLIIVLLGGAKRLILLAGTLNGLILPIALCCMLLACHNKKIVGEEYKHPLWLQILGWIVVLFAGYLAVITLPNLRNLFV